VYNSSIEFIKELQVMANYALNQDVLSAIQNLQIDTSKKKRVVYGCINVIGASGAGKSHLVSAMGEYLAVKLTPQDTNGKNLFIDTEKESSEVYKRDSEKRPNTYEFDPLNISAPYHPAVLIAAIKMGLDAGYSCITIDGFTPFWNKRGGILEMVNSYQTKQGKYDSIQGWAKVTPLLDELIETITEASRRCHVIVTTRAKSSVEEITDGNGRKKWIEVPMKAQARDDFKYEFNLVLSLDYDHTIRIDKCRPPFNSLDNMRFDFNQREKPEDYIYRFCDLVYRGLNLEDLSDLRTKSEIATGLVDSCKVRQIAFDVISHEVQKRGYGSFKEMPKSEMLKFLIWFDTLEYGTKTHPDGIKNVPTTVDTLETVNDAITPIEATPEPALEIPQPELEEPEF